MTPDPKKLLARPEHEAAYQDICALMARHAETLTGQELLAVAANMLGKLAALQDQRVMTPEMIMAVVLENFRAGNAQAATAILRSEGNV